MRCRWGCTLLLVTLVTNVGIPSFGQDTTPTPAVSSDDSGASEPTAPPDTDAPEVPETPAPVEEEEETPVPTAVEEEEEEEEEETDPPETTSSVGDDDAEDTPTPDTPSPTEEEVPETPSPVEEEEEPETPAPVEEVEETDPPETPSPTEAEEEAPETPSPVEETPQPTEAEVPETAAPQTPEPTEAEVPETAAPQTPEPTEAEVPETAAPQTPEPTEAEAPETPAPQDPTPAPTTEPTEPLTPEPTVRWTFAPADPWTESPGATPAPQREWTPPPTVKQTWAPADPWTASPGATPAPQREWTPPPTVKQTWAPADPWTASPGATPAPQKEWTPPPTVKQTWAPADPWTASPGATPAPQRVWTPPPTVKQTWAPADPWTASPGATFAPVAPWTASPGATPAPTRVWTASPGATFAPVAPWTASPGATWAPAVPWTASPGATWAPAVPWTASPGATWAPAVPWTGPPTIALLPLMDTIRAANTAGEFEGQFDTVLAGLEYAGLDTRLEGKALTTAFLPTDDAFEAEGITTASVTTLPLPVVQNLLHYHLLEGAVSSEVVAEAADFYTVLKVTLDVEPDGTLVDGEGNARSLVGDELRANNGFAHAVDGVLFPPDLFTLAENLNAKGGSFEGVFDIFLAGVARTGLEPKVSGVNGLYTVFAPADFAFESIGITNETVLTFDRDLLSTVLNYHVVANEAVDNSTLKGPLREFNTLLPGSTLRNAVDGGVLDETQMKAGILAADLQAVNGLMHAIDIVLEPYPMFTQAPTPAPTALLALVDTLVDENADRAGAYFGQFDTMIAALSASHLDLELAGPGPFTVFAPTNAAFAAAGVGPDNIESIPLSILEKLLLYHTLPGGVARAAIAQQDTLFTALDVDLETSGATLIDSQGNPVNIVEPDVSCSNGYLHYVDGVLMPPDLMTSLETYNEPGGSYEGVFDTFMAAMNVTGVSDEYGGLNGPYTILAPTDSAFAVLRLNSSNIGQANRTALSELLRYHVVDGEMETTDMDGVGTLRTLDYNAHALVVDGDGVIEDANGGQASVLVGNLESSNGMLHGIDAVLLPFPEAQLTGDMFPASVDRGVEDDGGSDNVEVAALSAGLAAAVILVAAAIAVHKRRQADAVKPPQVAPDEDGWTGARPVRGAPIHPA